MSRVVVPLAEGFEEIEAVAVIDVLRRAGVAVRALGVAARTVTGSHGIAVVADGLLADELGGDFDAVVLPGGMPGARHLAASADVLGLVRRLHDEGRLVAAVCAAPMALSAAGVLRGRAATSYPGFDLDCARYVEEPVVIDGNVVTSRGVGTALAFALTLVRLLVGEEAERTQRERMLIRT